MRHTKTCRSSHAGAAIITRMWNKVNALLHNFKCIYFNISCFKTVILLTTSNTINIPKIIIIYIWIAIGILLHTWPTEIWIHVCPILELSIIVNLHSWERNKIIFIKIDTILPPITDIQFVIIHPIKGFSLAIFKTTILRL